MSGEGAQLTGHTVASNGAADVEAVPAALDDAAPSNVGAKCTISSVPVLR